MIDISTNGVMERRRKEIMRNKEKNFIKRNRKNAWALDARLGAGDYLEADHGNGPKQ